MNKLIIKTVLTATLLLTTTLAQAVQFGEWRVLGRSQADTQKRFNLCIQQDGNWYISSAEGGWKGKWFEHAQGAPGGASHEVILQAIHAKEPRMRSLALPLDGSQAISTDDGPFAEVHATSGMTQNSMAWMVYKGPKCGPYLDENAAKPTSTASARPVDCLLKVDGKTLIKGICKLIPLGEGDFLLESEEAMGYLNLQEKGKGQVSWTKESGDWVPNVPFREVARKGACWESATVQLCARTLKP
jgi:hypothetical protein